MIFLKAQRLIILGLLYSKPESKLFFYFFKLFNI